MSIKSIGLPRCAHIGVWVPRAEAGQDSGRKLGLGIVTMGRRPRSRHSHANTHKGRPLASSQVRKEQDSSFLS